MEEQELREATAALSNSPSNLGQGVVWDPELDTVGWTSTDEICIPPYAEEMQMDWRTYYTAGVIHENHQTTLDFGAGIGGDLSLLDALPISDIEAAFEAEFHKNEDFEAFFIVAVIETAQRYIDFYSGDPDVKETLCTMEWIGSRDVDAFIDECGSQYVRKEDLGGVAVMWADMSQMTVEQRAELRASFEVGVAIKERS